MSALLPRYRGERLPSMAGLTMLPHNCETKKCEAILACAECECIGKGQFCFVCHSGFGAAEVVVKRPGTDAVKNSLVMPAFWLM